MESWQKVWREGFAPLLSDAALEALRRGLMTNDPQLIQGVITMPTMTLHNQQGPVAGACALGYARWKGEGTKTVADIVDSFRELCDLAEQAMRAPASCRWFFKWFDKTPRDQAFCQLLAEVERTLVFRLVLRSAVIGASVVPVEA